MVFHPEGAFVKKWVLEMQGGRREREKERRRKGNGERDREGKREC